MSAATPLPDPERPTDPRVERLRAAVASLAEVAVGDLDEPAVHRELAALEDVRRRVAARQYRLADALRSRQAARLRAAGRDAVEAGRRAERQTQRELSGQLHWTPGEARRATSIARQLAGSPTGRAGAAFDAGALSPRHARLLADTLAHLVGREREEAERLLLQRAACEDPTAFGRTCRRLLAETDHDAAMADEQRRHARRRASITTTDDGMVAVAGQWAGLDGEILHTAIHAYRRPDRDGQRRRPEQATADAIVEMARAALRATEAPQRRGAPPQVVVTLDYQTLLRDRGVAETTFTGPLPAGEIRRMLADAGVSRLLVDPDGVPLEAGEQTRTVPAGLWRALHTRDGGCIALDCDAPAIWCEVMHLATPYRLGGRLTLDTAAPGCREHHRKHDLHGWKVTWHHRRPILHHPDRPPPRPPDRDPRDRDPPADDPGRPGREAGRPPDDPDPHGDDPGRPGREAGRPPDDPGPEMTRVDRGATREARPTTPVHQEMTRSNRARRGTPAHGTVVHAHPTTPCAGHCDGPDARESASGGGKHRLRGLACAARTTCAAWRCGMPTHDAARQVVPTQ